MSKHSANLGGIGNLIDDTTGKQLDDLLPNDDNTSPQPQQEENSESPKKLTNEYNLRITQPGDWDVRHHQGTLSARFHFDGNPVEITVDTVDNGFKGEESAVIGPCDPKTVVYGRYFSRVINKGNIPPAILLALVAEHTNIMSEQDCDQLQQEHAEEGILREGMGRGFTKHEVRMIRRWCWISTGAPVQREWLNHTFEAAVKLGKENLFSPKCREIASLLTAALSASHLSNTPELYNDGIGDCLKHINKVSVNDEEVEHIIGTLVELLNFSADTKSRKGWSHEIGAALHAKGKQFDYKKPSKKVTNLNRQNVRHNILAVVDDLEFATDAGNPNPCRSPRPFPPAN